MMIDAARQMLADRGGDWPVRYAREVLGKDLDELTDAEVIEVVKEMLASAGRRSRREAVGADFRARIQSLGCGCPVVYDKDSRGRNIQSSAGVDHLTTCNLKTLQDRLFRVESE